VSDIEGNVYTTVKIGTQCWMAQNMRTTTYPDSSAITKGCSTAGCGDWATDQALYSCPPNSGNTAEDCPAAATLGMLYQWSAAMHGAASCNGIGESQPACSSPVQGICPAGWHMPSHYEWTMLERAVCASGSCTGDFPYDTSTTGYKGTDEGSQLATDDSGSSTNWPAGNLRSDADFDTSGFNLPPAGYRYTNGNYYDRANFAPVWSSLESDTNAWRRDIYYTLASVRRNTYSKAFGFSVRCLKD
jgi:uncharacterized protein (TIGR02145 family)